MVCACISVNRNNVPTTRCPDNTNANTASQPRDIEAQESLTEYPWDEDDSVHESEDASSVEDIIRTGAPNNQAASETNYTCKLTVLRAKPRVIIAHTFIDIITRSILTKLHLGSIYLLHIN